MSNTQLPEGSAAYWINNLTEPLIVGFDVQDGTKAVLWTRINGQWIEKHLGPYDAATHTNAPVGGHAWQINDRCEIIGDFMVGDDHFEFWQNGKLVDLASRISGGYSDFFAARINNQGVILVVCRRLTDGRFVRALLLPYEFKEVNPASGFDGETKPNWLMVPKDQMNWTKAITPANANSEIKFKVIPGPGGATVTPDHTNQSPETLGVSSPTVGDDSSLVTGIGTTFGTEGLKLSVKEYQPKTVVIHAVTQKYALDHYMPLQPNEGIANVVCVRPRPNATIIGATTPGGDDHQDITSGVIDTGANGVCETNANIQQDEQVIPNGWGLHKDIAPQYVPNAQELQAYLNNVFGLQTNTYFAVTRSDKSVDYDILKNSNGTYDKALNVDGRSSLYFTDEEKILESQVKDKSLDIFNVYFVRDFRFGDAVGKAAGDIAYIKDFTANMQDVMWVASHEVGHCFGLVHSEFPPSINPTYIPNSNPNKRLMYGRTFIENIMPRPKLLIKSEWEVINPKR